MDLKQLEYFAAIVEEGSITGAARRLHMAQPPLSHMLKGLEEELGTTLLGRGARRVTLTQSGEALYRRAKQMLSLGQAARRELEDLSLGVRGTLSIGTVSSSGAALLERRMLDYHEKYPQVSFEIHEGNTFALIELLDAGEIEIGIVRTPFHAQQTHHIYLEREPMAAVMAPKWESALPQRQLELGDLRGLPLIIYRRFEELILSSCTDLGFEPRLLCKNDDARTSLLWANAGLGVALVPQSAVNLVRGPQLVCRPLLDPQLYTQIAAIWRRDRYLSSIARNFLAVFAGPGDAEGGISHHARIEE